MLWCLPTFLSTYPTSEQKVYPISFQKMRSPIRFNTSYNANFITSLNYYPLWRMYDIMLLKIVLEKNMYIRVYSIKHTLVGRKRNHDPVEAGWLKVNTKLKCAGFWNSRFSRAIDVTNYNFGSLLKNLNNFEQKKNKKNSCLVTCTWCESRNLTLEKPDTELSLKNSIACQMR